MNEQFNGPINVGAYVSQEFYQKLLKLQSKLQLERKRHVSLSEVVREGLIKACDFHNVE